ncbi:hypothetical protein Q1695_010283 [Nippostrongylus brasiliensis]|nr:hypothetical protein Q1695_010283 [Nippostrongylus brasiliensis]
MQRSFLSPPTTPNARQSRTNVELSAREAAILAAMCGFAAFNLNSTDAKTMLHVFTLVPGIVFTFRIIAINNDSSTLSVSTMAVFWMYYGMGLICEVLLGYDESHAVVQLALVGALGVAAYRGIPSAEQSSSDFRTILSGSYSLIQQRTQKSPTQVRQARKRSLQSLSVETAVNIGTRTRTMSTQSCSDLTSLTAREITDDLKTLMTAIVSDTDTALEMFPSPASLTVASSQKTTSKNKAASPLSLMTARLTDPDTAIEMFPTPVPSQKSAKASTGLVTAVQSDTRTAVPIRSPATSATAPGSQVGPSKLLDEMTESPVLIDHSGLIAEPLKTLRFKLPSDEQTITLKNVSNQQFRWTVKTNAIYEIQAFPAHGVIHRGEEIQIKVVLNAENIAVPGANCDDDKAILQLETDADSCIRVRITGVPLAVAAAKIEIHELVLAIIRESFRHTVTVPSRFVGLIIGRNGKKIENVKLTTGANIKIGRNENGFTKVSIVGNYRRIVAAVTMIKDRVDSVGTATSVYDRPDRQEFHELLNEAMGDSSM